MAYIVLEQLGKSPIDLGVPPEDLDPCWIEGVLAVKAGFVAQQAMMLESHTTRPH